MSAINIILAFIMSMGVANYNFRGEPTVTVVDMPVEEIATEIEIATETEVPTEITTTTTTVVEEPNVDYKKQATDETIYEELDAETNYIEIDIEEGLSYSVYKYDNLDDYNNHSNKKLVKTVNSDEYELISIEMQDIVKNDYPAEYNSNTIITENFLENKYMSLNLKDPCNIINDMGYSYDTNDDGVMVGVSSGQNPESMIAELQTLVADDGNKLYFQVGFPVAETEFQLIPLYNIVADNKIIETRIIMPNNQLDYKFFACVDVQIDKPTALIVGDKTDERMGLQ